MKKIKFTVLHLFALVLTSPTLFAQSFKLSGTLIDSVSNRPLEYVTISLCNRSIGTASNPDGKFTLIVDAPHISDSIRFSHVGFETKTIALSKSLYSQGDVIFTLHPLSRVLEEVTVRPRSIADILNSAIQTTNSSIAHSSILDVYFREFAYLDDDLFKFADAAIFYKIDAANKKVKVETFVAESRIVKDSVSSDQKWKSDVESLIDADKSAKEFYTMDYLQKFTGKNRDIYFDFSLQDLGQVTKIEINPKSTIRKYLPSAIVYIDQLTNQIQRVDYGYDSHLQYMPSINLFVLKYAVKKDWSTNIYHTGDQVFLRYSKVMQDIDFKLGKKSGVLRSNVEVLVTDVAVEADKLKDMSLFKNSSITKNGNSYTSRFWEDRTAIIPTTEELEEIKQGL
ncbi:carboxypeptidase-like regulatory domain-containing protein [Sphingobacterium paludis]|uniref:Carboxypeptidase-like protein n=1 Tax=Sphingobacterium paludis TaxID=1476465 RepID=A0A4R7D1H4_9SPHI|nr:carboxypeptidase-like regulatory domain-containing protein [Sphingobacterium paludis]TDS13901.1 carboxypeptidase-like protein [Sphingobacterium paludis]